MSELWHFKCLNCEARNSEDLENGDKTLLGILEHIDDIRSILGGDESGFLEISIIGMGTDPVTFLMDHYGEGHNIVIESDNGQIKRIGEW
jgi:hypothetical protein